MSRALRAVMASSFVLSIALEAFPSHAQPVEKFRGTVLSTVPMAGITATMRGSGAFAIRATEQGLNAALGANVASRLGTKLLILRVGAKLTDDLLPACMNESVRDSQQCPQALGTLKDGPFDVTFGQGQPALPGSGESIFAAYLRDARYKDVYAVCGYVMPGARRLSCAVVFLHDGDEYKIDSATVSDTTDLGLLRCAALRLTRIVWTDVRPFDHLCPGQG
jgi:hypothetical protein